MTQVSADILELKAIILAQIQATVRQQDIVEKLMQIVTSQSKSIDSLVTTVNELLAENKRNQALIHKD